VARTSYAAGPGAPAHRGAGPEVLAGPPL